MFDWITGRRKPPAKPPTAKASPDGPRPEDTLSAIVRGLHHAASSAQNMMAQQYMTMIDHFFDATVEDREGIPKGSLVPKVVQMQVDGKHHLAVPLISLMNPKGLYLREMKIELTVQMTASQLKQALSPYAQQDIDRSSFSVQISPRSDRASGEKRSSEMTDITVTFEAHDPPEGVMKIIDRFANQLTPRTNGTPGPPLVPGDDLRHST